MTLAPDGDTLISVGDDKNIRFWGVNPISTSSEEGEGAVAKHSIISKVRIMPVIAPG